VVADRQVPPVGQQRLLVGPEDPADVGGVVQRGVEVDIVADLERQQQRGRVEGEGGQCLRLHQLGDLCPGLGPRVGTERHEGVEGRSVQLRPHGRDVDDLVAVPDPDARRRPSVTNTPYGR
jgi:hypothetical protein